MSNATHRSARAVIDLRVPSGPGTFNEGTAQMNEILTILGRTQVESASGYSRSTIYLRIAQGLWPKPVSIGPRAVGWPATEIKALNAARIAGKAEHEIRDLVMRLETARRGVGAAL
jgi:prophage regulatory protein